jgi:hypothetical protein
MSIPKLNSSIHMNANQNEIALAAPTLRSRKIRSKVEQSPLRTRPVEMRRTSIDARLAAWVQRLGYEDHVQVIETYARLRIAGKNQAQASASIVGSFGASPHGVKQMLAAFERDFKSYLATPQPAIRVTRSTQQPLERHFFTKSQRLKNISSAKVFAIELHLALNPNKLTYGNCGVIAYQTMQVIEQRGRVKDLRPIDKYAPGQQFPKVELGAKNMLNPLINGRSSAIKTFTDIQYGSDSLHPEKGNQVLQRLNRGEAVTVSLFSPLKKSMYSDVPDHAFTVTQLANGEIIGIDAQRGIILNYKDLVDTLSHVRTFKFHGLLH